MISSRKIALEKQKIISNCKSCSNGCKICFGYGAYIDQMAEAEIPVDYWFREMDNFYGDECFKQDIIKYIDDIHTNFSEGTSLCFVGSHGTGKTMAACSILKRSLLEGYRSFYTTMVDIGSKLSSPNSYRVRNMIKEYDFFVIDEVDQRFFLTQGSHDFFGNHFENILRTRSQNKLPTIICTNSLDPSGIFNDNFGESFSSLRSQFMKIKLADGKDARKGKEKL